MANEPPFATLGSKQIFGCLALVRLHSGTATMKTLLTSFLGTALVQLANIASGVLAARLLLPEGRGAMAMAMLWPTLFAAVGFLSIDQAITYFSASRRETVASLFTAGFVLVCALSVITVVAGHFVLPLLFSAAQDDILDDAQFYLLFVPLNFVGLLIMSVFSGTLRFGQWNFQRSFVPCFYLSAIVGFYAGGFITVRSFLIASLLANLVLVAMGMALLSRDRIFGPFRWQAVSLIIQYCLPVHIAMLILIVSQRLDQAMISIYLPFEDLGFYVVAGSIAGTVSLVTGTLTLVAFPKIANEGSAEGKAILLARYFQLSIALSLSATIVVFFASPLLITVFFGTAFMPAVQLSQILLIGTVPASITLVLATGYRAHRRLMPINYGSITTLVVTASMLVILLPRMGTSGAAWSVVMAQWASCLVLLGTAGGVLRVSMSTLFFPRSADIASLRDGITAWLVRTPKGEL